jgi:hypothetical protein
MLAGLKLVLGRFRLFNGPADQLPSKLRRISPFRMFRSPSQALTFEVQSAGRPGPHPDPLPPAKIRIARVVRPVQVLVERGLMPS